MSRALLLELYQNAVARCVEQSVETGAQAWQFEENFAELVVRECLKIIDEYRTIAAEDSWCNTDGILTSIETAISETFGFINE